MDNNWCFSKHHPSCNDGKGNINNIIDTSNINIDEYIKTKIKEEKNNKDKNNNNNSGGLKKSASNYTNIYPSKNTMNLDAVIVPDNYKGFYNINTYHKQYLIGNNEYFDKLNLNEYIGGNSSFIKVRVPPHINL